MKGSPILSDSSSVHVGMISVRYSTGGSGLIVTILLPLLQISSTFFEEFHAGVTVARMDFVVPKLLTT